MKRELRLTLYLIELKRKRAFKKFSYRGVDLDQYVPWSQWLLDRYRPIAVVATTC